jgi:hypothetical protein
VITSRRSVTQKDLASPDPYVVPLGEVAQNAQVDKARGSNVVAVRVPAPVTDQIEAELSFGMLDPAVGLSCGHLHVVSLLAGLDWACGQPVQCLFQDAHRLAHLSEPDHDPIHHVPFVPDHHVPVERIVDRVGLGTPNVVGDPARSEQWPGATIGYCHLRGQDTDADRSRAEDVVGHGEALEFVDAERQALVDEVLRLGNEPLRQVASHPAEAVVVAHHSRAGRHLEQIEDELPLLQGVEHTGEVVAQVVADEANRYHVAHYAGKLCHDDPDVLRALRNLGIEELLDCHRVGEVVRHGRDIVEAIRVRHVAQPGVPLADLLVAAVEVAQHRL